LTSSSGRTAWATGEIEALNATVKDVDAQIWVHTCWGNYGGTPAYVSYEGDQDHVEGGIYEIDKRPKVSRRRRTAGSIFPKVLEADIDVLNFEIVAAVPPTSSRCWMPTGPKPFVPASST